jgi:hypothetical protein
LALQRISRTGAAPPTGLAGSVSAAAMSFGLTNTAGYPTGTGGPFVLVLDPGTTVEEKVLCASLSGTSVTVAPSGRGWDGTTAAAHSAGAGNVAHVFTAAEADDANAHIYVPSRDDHTQYALANGGRADTMFVFNGATITVPPDAPLTVPFDSIAWGNVNEYNISLYEYVTPFSGVYEIFATINMPGSGIAALAVVQGSMGVVGIGPPSVPGTNPFSGSADNRASVRINRQASAGDIFYIQCRSKTGGSVPTEPYSNYALYTCIH